MNHLIKAVEILKERYKGEIYAWDEWSHNLWSWTITIDADDNDNSQRNVVAYRAKGNVTDWDDFVVLPSFNVQYELIGD